MQDQHTQESVAFMYPDKTGPLAGKCFVGGAQVGDIPLYTFPPDAAARVAELENQRDELLAALNEINNWLVCACIATPEDMAQSFQHMQQVADAAIASMKGCAE